MKRYRVIGFDFDGRAHLLDEIKEDWEPQVKELHRQNQARLLSQLEAEFGSQNFDQKLANFKELGGKQISVVAFHNKFLHQARQAFVQGQYYPALTAACALGERILNHLMIALRDNYKAHPLYKKVYSKDSFDYWPVAIDALSVWGVLTADAVKGFQDLNQRRNNALHFNLDTEINDRQLALEAIKNAEEIVSHQFSGFGPLPWLLPIPGECYIRKEYEQSPFIRLVYLPNCCHVGYKHVVTRLFPWNITDVDDYPTEEVSDDEFARLRVKFTKRPLAPIAN